jgi:hypothetical protein
VPRVRYQKRIKAGPHVAGFATPTNTVAPVITGDTAGETSTTSDGTWSDADAFTYQWYLDGVALVGETTNSIDTDEGWVGQTLSVIVCGGNGGGMTCAASAGVVLQEASAYTGPLDLVPGAAWKAAYSQQCLAAAFAGPLVRLRESGGNTEQNFSPVDHAVSASAIATFLNGNSGFGVTWYDQSGNSKDASQATTANQPQWNANAIGSLPTFQFASTLAQTFFGTAAAIEITGGAMTVFAVFKNTNATEASYLCGMNYNAQAGDGELFAVWNDVDSANKVVIDSSSDAFGTNEMRYRSSTGSTAVNTDFVVAISVSATGAIIRVNGVSMTPVDAGFDMPIGTIAGKIGVGNADFDDQGSGAGIDGYISELLIAQGALSLSDVQAVEQNMMTRYGIS